MTAEQIALWGTFGAWANAIAMGAAAVFAFMAWRSDRGGAATSRIDAFIVSLTSGTVASARDRLTAWVEKHRGEQPPANARIETVSRPLRKFAVTDDAERQLRHGVFEILWLLQRCSGLVRDLGRTDEASQDVVLQHISLVAEGLNSFASALSEEEVEAFKNSAISASGALAKLKDKFPTLSSGAVWTSTLPELTADDVVKFRYESDSGGKN